MRAYIKFLNSRRDLVMIMNRFLIMLLVTSAFSSSINATEFGTASEARDMLERAIAILKTNESAALAAFNNIDGEFRVRDLYVFCGGPNGKFTAHPKGAGKWSLRLFEDIAGKAVGEEMYSVAKEGEISEVAYLLPRDDSPIPYEKTSLITMVGDQLCGVGYYNPEKRTRAGNLTINSSLGVVAGGYDVVAYFTLGQATTGTKNFSYEWLGSEWHFLNSEHRDMFIENPVDYTPQYGGYCSSGMSKGFLVPIDPETWQIVGGKLYLHFSKRAKSGWSQNRDTNITNADANWEKIKPGLSN